MTMKPVSTWCVSMRRVDADRVRVPARVGAGLVDDDLVLAVQQVRGDQAGDAGADDRDPHRAAPPRGCRRGCRCVGASASVNLRRAAPARITSPDMRVALVAGVQCRRRRTRPPMKRAATPPTDRRRPARSPVNGHQRAPEPLQVHPGTLRRVLALAEGRRAVHRRPPRRGRLPDRRGAGAPRQHLELDRRALLPGARLRGLPRAAGGRARGIPPRERQGRRGPAAASPLGAAVLARPERVRDGARRRPPERRGDRAQGLAQLRRGADRGDRRGREGARRRHRPDGLLRQLPAPPADAARPARRRRREPLAGGAQPPRADRRRARS